MNFLKEQKIDLMQKAIPIKGVLLRIQSVDVRPRANRLFTIFL